MKKKRQMKKIISWILTGALVLAGAGSIGAAKAEARGTTLKWTGEVEMGTAWGWSGEAPAEGIVPSVTDEGSTLELNAVEWNDIAIGITVDLTDFIEPYITVVATPTIDGVMNQYAVTNSDYSILYAGETTENGLTSSLLSAETTTITGNLDKEVATYHILAPGRTVTGVYVHEWDKDPITGEWVPLPTTEPEESAEVPTSIPVVEPTTPSAIETEAPTVEPTQLVSCEPEPTPTIERTTALEFDVTATIVDPEWSFIESQPVSIIGNGTYAIEMTVASDIEDINLMWVDAYSLGYENDLGIQIASSAMKVGDEVFAAEGANWWYRDCASLENVITNIGVVDAEGKKAACRRMIYRNPWMEQFDDQTGEAISDVGIDVFNGKKISVNKGEKVTIYITVSGMLLDNSDADVEIPEYSVQPTATPIVNYVRTTADSFELEYCLFDLDWKMLESESVEVTGNGIYAISGTAVEDMKDILLFRASAGSLGYDNDLNIQMEGVVLKVGENGGVFDASNANWWYKDAVDLEDAKTISFDSFGDRTHCRALECRNPYSLYFNDQTGETIGSDLSTEYIDAFRGVEITAEKGDTIILYVKVSGMAVDNVNANIPVPEVNVSGSNNTEATATPEATVEAPPIPTDESASSGETTATIPPASVDNTTIVTTPPTSGDVTPTVTVNPDMNDSEDSEEEDEEDDEEEEDEDEEELEEGDTFQKAGFIYTLLNSKSVTVSGYEKNVSSLTIGETVTYKSIKYKIVGIDYEAFLDMTSLKKVTIGSNVKSIGKSAFSGCKKLKTIHVKTKKIVKVGKNTFKDINPLAKIFIPKKKYGAYKALFRKKGQKSTVRILKGSW